MSVRKTTSSAKAITSIRFNIQWRAVATSVFILAFAGMMMYKLNQFGSTVKNETIPPAVGVAILHMAWVQTCLVVIFVLWGWCDYTRRLDEAKIQRLDLADCLKASVQLGVLRDDVITNLLRPKGDSLEPFLHTNARHRTSIPQESSAEELC